MTRRTLQPRGRISFSLQLLCTLLLGFSTAARSRADDTLVAAGASWRYLDNGSNQGSAWRNTGFVDSAWPSAPAQLGYGDGDEATVVGFGPDAGNKFITTYFRRTFTVASVATYLGLTLHLVRDDGAVVYLNGVEIARHSMPAGAIGHTTLASATAGGSDESVFHQIALPLGPLVNGSNVLAVEIHQVAATSSDISFDLALIGNTSASVGRGPYLQQGTSTSVIVRWRTNVVTNARVRYGTTPLLLNLVADDASLGTNHQVTVSLLSPGTRYYYSVGTTAAALAGGDSGHFFTTSPAEGGAPPIRIWVVGDSGTADANAAAVRDEYLAFTGAVPTDVWLMLGDNAYPDGTDSAYQAAVFDTYPTLLRNTVLWPTLGNHDAEPDGVSFSIGMGPYFDMFTLPSGGESGGLSSGTEAYYSFDYGNIHFINLNSTGSDRAPGGAMLSWLASDLAATTKTWIIAYWHHPPYTKGSHDSDNPVDSEGRMFDMREFALPILEAGGVDLVLTGHSHAYERSLLIRGHYGTSDTLASHMIVDDGDGREDGDGAYQKKPDGAVYVVAGSSGLTSGGSLDHPAMFVSFNALGSVVLDVDGGRLDASFLSGGTVADHFTLIKGPECGVETSQPTYGPGETIALSSFRLANLGPAAAATEIKLWLEIAGAGPANLISIGADGSVALPSQIDVDLGPIPLLTVMPGFPLGAWSIGCRFIDPATGATLALDEATFLVTP